MPTPHNRIALVTGASGGIGRATTGMLVRAGWRVVLAGRRLDALRESIAICADPFGDIAARAFAVPTDITRPDSVAALFDFVRARFGRLDLLFNSAGLCSPAMPLEDLDVASWRSAVDVNLTGTFLCTQQAFRIMKAQQPRGGRIVNAGSVAAQSPRPHSAADAASKHAVNGLTRAAALEGRPFEIAVGQIDLGNVDSGGAGPTTGWRQADGSVRAEPHIEVDQVAASVLHMASLPIGTNVLSMTVLATGMPFVGRG